MKTVEINSQFGSATLPVTREADSMIEDAQEALEKLPEPRLSSLCQMLTQSLTSQDKVMLEGALSVADRSLVRDSIRILPRETLLPLLDAIVERIERRPWRAGRLLPWLKVLLQTHTLTLSQMSDLPQHLAPLKSLIEVRCRTYRRMVSLQGKLDLMLGMTEETVGGGSRSRTEKMELLLSTPLATFDESEGEDELAEEMMLSQDEESDEDDEEGDEDELSEEEEDDDDDDELSEDDQDMMDEDEPEN